MPQKVTDVWLDPIFVLFMEGKIVLPLNGNYIKVADFRLESKK